MKRNYKYEAEMLHWLDGGDIEMRYCYEPWEPFDGFWAESDGWEYRIAEPELCEDEGCDHHGTVHVCSITFSDATGNRHQFVGQGEVW
jgi:hypothetical protein